VVVNIEDTEDERYCPAVFRIAVSMRLRAERESVSAARSGERKLIEKSCWTVFLKFGLD